MNTNNNIKDKKKALGPIRWNAIIPFSIFSLLAILYFSLFFDRHLKSAMEWIGYKVAGAEVNIGDLRTSFFNAHIRISRIEVTDAEKPQFNTIQIGDVRFGMLWDALLRAKISVEEIAVEGIEFGTQRSHPGKVAPPEPPRQGPGFSDKLKDQFLEEAQSQYKDNVFGDIVALLQGSSGQNQIKNLENQLPSKKLAEDLDKKIKERQKFWDEKFKSMPQAKDFQVLNERLTKVKIKDFKSPQELEQSLKEIDGIVKDSEQKFKTINGASQEFNNDLKVIQDDYKKLDAQFKTDVETLKQHFKIPKIDAANIGKAVFLKYLSPYISKFNHYKALAEKYIPPKFVQKKSKVAAAGAENDEIAVHPRENGKTYEFGRPNSYPLFWIKRISISSKANASKNSGDIKGAILNITSNQRTIGKPTTASIAGDFPGMDVRGISLNASLDNTKEEALVNYSFKVSSFPVAGKELVNGDVTIAFNKAIASTSIVGKLEGFKKLDLEIRNSFSQIDYKIEAKNAEIKSVLSNIFTGIPTVLLNAAGSGTLPAVEFKVDTNLGAELQKGLEREVQVKIEAAKAKVQKIIDDEIGKQKALVEAELNKLKSQVEGEIKKVQDQANQQKQMAEQKLNQAKKDAENQAKGKVLKEGEKALDDLKKKFGF